MLLCERCASIEWTQTRPSIILSSPAISSPSSTSTIFETVVGASTSVEVFRDSRM